MTTQVSDQVPERMPRGVKGALVGVWFQGVANFFAGAVISNALDITQGQDVPHLGLVRLSVYASFFAAGALFVSGVFARKRFSWVRVTLLVVECWVMLFALIGFLVLGAPTVILSLAIPALIAKTMLGVPAREWFHR
ncbi:MULTISPECIES: hypothetical protein [unclassified Streptomyces]|uniref:hypothetical protein n=1 Tax=unclassified Streptomyces TaxID=2593676 RepID=UPI0032507F53